MTVTTIFYGDDVPTLRREHCMMSTLAEQKALLEKYQARADWKMTEGLTFIIERCILRVVERNILTTLPIKIVNYVRTMYFVVSVLAEEHLWGWEENSFHACITDPPYGMGMEEWDHSVPTVEIWQEVYRILNLSAFLLSFCSPQLYHRMACNVEDAGFEIKDQIMWMTTTKMPKVNRLKPAHEPIVVAQKPTEGSLQDNHNKYGVGFINTVDTRIPWDKDPPKRVGRSRWKA